MQPPITATASCLREAPSTHSLAAVKVLLIVSSASLLTVPLPPTCCQQNIAGPKWTNKNDPVSNNFVSKQKQKTHTQQGPLPGSRVRTSTPRTLRLSPAASWLHRLCVSSSRNTGWVRNKTRDGGNEWATAQSLTTQIYHSVYLSVMHSYPNILQVNVVSYHTLQ